MEDGREPKVFADVAYGPKKQRRDSPDVVLRYERQAVAIEVVAGALQVKTLTHGDLQSFEHDLEKLIYKKATQLTKRIAEIKDGMAADVGLDFEGVSRVLPVIVSAAPFPVRPEIMKRIRRDLKDRQLLVDRMIGPISIISAEELAALEAHVEASGETILSVLSEWKAHRRTGDIYLKNFLVERGETDGPAAHHSQMFKAASAEMFEVLFHKKPERTDLD
jgi:hypothetical protein